MKLINFLLLLAATYSLTVGCAPSSNSITDSNASGIIDGAPVASRTTNETRSVVLIELINKSKQTVTHCSGVLIGKNMVLTAAHCFKMTDRPEVTSFNVIFENTYKANSADHGNLRHGLTYVAHDKFTFDLLENDIAVGVFLGEIPAGFQPVAMDDKVDADYSNREVYDYGYGRTQEPIDSDKSVHTAVLYRGVMLINDAYKKYSNRYITSMASPSQVCSGDSGGPQFIHDKGVTKIVGINSGTMSKVLNPKGPHCIGPSLLTKVSYFYPWIQEQRKKLLPGSQK